MIYDNVIYFAKQKGFNVHRLELAAGLSNGVISKWKNYSPRLCNLLLVAKALDVSIDDLLNEEVKTERR